MAKKLYGFNQENARALNDVARRALTTPQSKQGLSQRGPMSPNVRAYVVEPLEEIPASSISSGGCVVVGSGECWLVRRDQTDDHVIYQVDENNNRVVVTVFNLLTEAIGDSLGSGSGSGCSPGRLYFATQDMFGDLYIVDRFETPEEIVADVVSILTAHMTSTITLAVSPAAPVTLTWTEIESVGPDISLAGTAISLRKNAWYEAGYTPSFQDPSVPADVTMDWFSFFTLASIGAIWQENIWKRRSPEGPDSRGYTWPFFVPAGSGTDTLTIGAGNNSATRTVQVNGTSAPPTTLLSVKRLR